MLKASLRSIFFISLTVLIFNLVPVAANAVTTRLTTGATDQFQPDISGSRVVWLDGNNHPDYEQLSNVYLLTLGGTALKLTTVKKAHAPAISTAKVVWEDLRNDTGGGIVPNSDIFGYTLPAGPQGAIDTDAAPQVGPDVSGSQVVWSGFKNSQWDIFLKKTDGSVVQITDDAAPQSRPRIDGDKIVWQDDRNGHWDIYLYNITTTVETRITSNAANQTEPDISGNRIVWSDARGSFRNIYTYDLSNPVANGAVVNANAATQHSPRISGSRVVWTDWRNGSYIGNVNSDIYSKDLAAGPPKRVTPDGNHQNSPSVSGNRIVWADNRNGGWDIYMDELDTVGPTAFIITPTISTKISKRLTFKVRWRAVDPSPSSGIASYDVQRKINAGGLWKFWKSGTAATSDIFKGGAGRTYYFRSRARDAAGNVGAWSPVKRTIVPYDDSSKGILKIQRGFNGVTKDSRSNDYLSTLRYSTTRGHYLSYGFTGDSVAIIVRAHDKGAIAKVYIDGKFIKKINTRRPKTKFRKIVFSTNLAKTKHVLKIVNLATRLQPRLDIDAIAVGR